MGSSYQIRKTKLMLRLERQYNASIEEILVRILNATNGVKAHAARRLRISSYLLTTWTNSLRLIQLSPTRWAVPNNEGGATENLEDYADDETAASVDPDPIPQPDPKPRQYSEQVRQCCRCPWGRKERDWRTGELEGIFCPWSTCIQVTAASAKR